MTATKSLDIKELVEHLGGFGKYQIYVFVLGCYGTFVTGIYIVSILFVAYEPNYRCRVPGCESTNSSATYDGDFLNFSTPFDEAKGKWDSCHTFALAPNQDSSPSEGSCTPDSFDRLVKANCTEFVYDTSLFKSSTVMEYDLVCGSAWLQPSAISAYMVGMLIGAISLGDLADRLGRKKGLVAASLVASVGGIVSGFSMHYYMFLATRMVCGMGTIAIYQICFIIAMELVSPQYRTFVGVMIQVPFALGEASLALFAFYIREWRWLQVACSLPCLVMLSFLWILPESLRWLLSEGRNEEVKQIVKRIERMNKLNIPKEIYEALDQKVEMNVTVISESPSPIKVSSEGLEEKKRNLFDLLRYPNTRKRTFNLIFCWAVVTLSYYGLSANSAKLGGNVFIGFIGIMLIEIPSCIFAYLVLDKMGRKGTLSFTMLLGGLSLIAAGCTPKDLNWLIVTFSMAGKCGISAAFAVVYIYTVEIFPTSYRSLGLGTCSMSARIGGILAPFIADLDKLYTPLPPLIFGILAIASGFLLFLLPETLGSELPQTLDESENFGVDQSILYFSCWTKKRKINITEKGNHLNGKTKVGDLSVSK